MKLTTCSLIFEIDRDELERLRKILQLERESSVRRDQEIEEIRQKSAEDIQKLHDNIASAEKVFEVLIHS